ncbi:hypothetical protein HBN50_03655 [Halobacteriovorax sp. GB3]|uniref:hypothetical protein n=1 Tax=Halobacteriovorax sp. GB3 TaxID=2719615 RepID=UPI002360CA02|nr:hypothetical protein [Halobacteriovorax sp. GB3]MDD0852174.1 hypothetical protein [Halobacteriovorax sp. GB3]
MKFNSFIFVFFLLLLQSSWSFDELDLDYLKEDQKKLLKIPQRKENKGVFKIQLLDSHISVDDFTKEYEVETPKREEIISIQARNKNLQVFGLYDLCPSDWDELDFDIYYYKLIKDDFNQLVKRYPFLKDKEQGVQRFKLASEAKESQ